MDSFRADDPTATRYWDAVNLVFLLHRTAAATTTATAIPVDNSKVAVAALTAKTSKNKVKLWFTA